MLIDIHTHVFPSHIAERAMQGMTAQIVANQKYYNAPAHAHADGTAEDLLRTMDEGGCTHSVLCPVITNPKSTVKTNDYSLSLESERLIPFAGLMPDTDDWEMTLESIAENGFRGIKLHPVYQNFDIDGERGVAVIKKAESLGLAVIFHAGLDIGFPPSDCVSPARIARLLDKVDGHRLIAAHLGGWMQWEDVRKYLAGSPILFDTSFVGDFIGRDLCHDIIRSHGADKILFGSDFPWSTAGETLSFVNSLGLTKDELDCILYKNAAALLSISETD